MPRIARGEMVGGIYHIINMGNMEMQVFNDKVACPLYHVPFILCGSSFTPFFTFYCVILVFFELDIIFGCLFFLGYYTHQNQHSITYTT